MLFAKILKSKLFKSGQTNPMGGQMNPKHKKSTYRLA